MTSFLTTPTTTTPRQHDIIQPSIGLSWTVGAMCMLTVEKEVPRVPSNLHGDKLHSFGNRQPFTKLSLILPILNEHYE